MPDTYDLCIIGAGTAGFAGAMRALDLGRHVCLIEADEIGGTGVMWGALSSKTMWELAKDYDIAAKVDRGYRSAGLVVDYSAVRNTVIQAVKEKQYQMLSQIETYSPERWKGPGSITFIRGRGSFVATDRIAVTGADGRQEIRADFFLICTGSKPRDFPHIAVDQQRILNSDGILNLKEFPKRLVIIGAGIVGCEYATIFSNFDQTKVFLVDHQERIIPFEDEDLSRFVSRNLRRNQVEIFHSAILRTINARPGHLEVILDFNDGHSQVVEADAALISIGRTPNLAGLNLERIGLSTDTMGFLTTDENCLVKGNIYAAGDVVRHPALVNIAETEARYAVKHMFNAIRWPLRYRNMSTVMFFKPAVAAVGLNEQACRKKKIPYRVAVYSNALVTRAIAMQATDGFVKIIVSHDDQQMLLGMRAAGPQASTTIMSIALLMDQEKGIDDVLKSVHPHPTMSENIQECLRVLLGKSVYKPHAFPHYIQIRNWTPDDEEPDSDHPAQRHPTKNRMSLEVK
ncbi:MAG: NAD(P)/FAD-dependent oxidoreductase [Desulfobacterales bacterium]